MTDYKELCRELFGTTDEKEIREFFSDRSKHVKSGRKPIVADEEYQEMLALAAKGASVSELAEKYNTSRQVIGRYLNRRPEYGYTVRLTYMNKQFPCTVIDADYLNKKIKIQNRTDDLLHRAFGVNESPSWSDYEAFLESRCFPRSRQNLKELLSDMGLDSYDPLQIIEKTQGRTYDDFQWIKTKHYPRTGGLVEAEL